MSVGVQREACRKMPQHARYGFDVHTVLQCQCCEGVSEIRQLFITTKTQKQQKPDKHQKSELL